MACLRAHGARRPVRWLLAGLGFGGALSYLLDPARGRQRRDRAAGALRHGRRRLKRSVRATALQTAGRARGVLHRLLPAPSTEPLDDAGLAHKVESVLFRDPHVPKGQISINAEDGAVFLRGQVESAELIDDLVASVRMVQGVTEVVSLLHLPGTEAPHPGARQAD
jgi:hypothetical protein